MQFAIINNIKDIIETQNFVNNGVILMTEKAINRMLVRLIDLEMIVGEVIY